MKTKLALEKLAAGEVSRVVVDTAAAADNVPRSVEREGHTVVSVTETGPGLWETLARKG